MKYFFLLASVLLITLQYHVEALPAQILIIQHAEKQSEGDSLSTKGKERAAALAPYFIETEELVANGPPIAIYAMAASKTAPSKHSIDTVKSLAEVLKQTLKDSFEKDDFKKMVEEIKNDPSYRGKTVLIAWDHSNIPEIARAFGALQTPARWPADVFDRTWLITYSNTGKANYKNLPQRLMFGDSAN